MLSKPRKLALVIAILIVIVAILIRYFDSRSHPDTYRDSGLVIGVEGSTHSHSSILVFINDKPYDFSGSRYQHKTPLVHFEDDNGTFIHKHADGVSLPYFFETLGIILSKECLVLDTGFEYCNTKDKSLRIMLNRKPFEGELARYELQPGDKWLIDYGDTEELELMLRVNNVPNLPESL